MMTVNVQFADSSETTIITYFGGPQDPDVFTNLGTVSTSDPRYKAFYDSLPDASWLPFPD
jgi:hypothetical protein